MTVFGYACILGGFATVAIAPLWFANWLVSAGFRTVTPASIKLGALVVGICVMVGLGLATLGAVLEAAGGKP